MIQTSDDLVTSEREREKKQKHQQELFHSHASFLIAMYKRQTSHDVFVEKLWLMHLLLEASK